MSGNMVFRTLGAIVLAAGLSRRMGDENKLFKPLADKPLISYTLDTVTKLGLRQVLTVASKDADKIDALLPPRARLILNDQPADGMGHSIAKGAHALDQALRGVFIVLGDMPYIERTDYQKLAEAFQASGDAAICVPVHEGRRGHPVLFGRTHIPALASLTGDRGARGLLSSPHAQILEVAGCSAGVLIDLDTPEAFMDAERRRKSDLGISTKNCSSRPKLADNHSRS